MVKTCMSFNMSSFKITKSTELKIPVNITDTILHVPYQNGLPSESSFAFMVDLKMAR